MLPLPRCGRRTRAQRTSGDSFPQSRSSPRSWPSRCAGAGDLMPFPCAFHFYKGTYRVSSRRTGCCRRRVTALLCSSLSPRIFLLSCARARRPCRQRRLSLKRFVSLTHLDFRAGLTWIDAAASGTVVRHWCRASRRFFFLLVERVGLCCRPAAAGSHQGH